MRMASSSLSRLDLMPGSGATKLSIVESQLKMCLECEWIPFVLNHMPDFSFEATIISLSLDAKTSETDCH